MLGLAHEQRYQINGPLIFSHFVGLENSFECHEKKKHSISWSGAILFKRKTTDRLVPVWRQSFSRGPMKSRCSSCVRCSLSSLRNCNNIDSVPLSMPVAGAAFDCKFLTGTECKSSGPPAAPRPVVFPAGPSLTSPSTDLASSSGMIPVSFLDLKNIHNNQRSKEEDEGY